jgi:hypothetical protein
MDKSLRTQWFNLHICLSMAWGKGTERYMNGSYVTDTCLHVEQTTCNTNTSLSATLLECMQSSNTNTLLQRYLTIFMSNLTLNDHELSYCQGTGVTHLSACSNTIMPKITVHFESVIAAIALLLYADFYHTLRQRLFEQITFPLQPFQIIILLINHLGTLRALPILNKLTWKLKF